MLQVVDEEESVKSCKSFCEEPITNSFEHHFRSVVLDNIPLPTSGGHVTGTIHFLFFRKIKEIICTVVFSVIIFIGECEIILNL